MQNMAFMVAIHGLSIYSLSLSTLVLGKKPDSANQAIISLLIRLLPCLHTHLKKYT